ncbi:phospholipase A2 inhibitor gamma subunit B-like [Aquarana catesbeiana]|uniref:phospholipase A2 inhibitor gamma subunit B-like n=1 Tax=Aquarana catesbeiana TaxID=8400 RepID=UPI003CC9A6C6
MASIFQILGVLLSLAASGYSLLCTECSSSSDSCTGPSVTCPDGSVCGAIYTEGRVSGKIFFQSYKMACVTQEECDITGSGTIPQNAKIKMGRSCCETDECTPPTPSLPKDSSVYNGVKCPACISTDSAYCYSSNKIKCTGDEDKCFLQATETTGQKTKYTAVRGCATKSVCDLGSRSFSSADEKSYNYVICSSRRTRK